MKKLSFLLLAGMLISATIFTQSCKDEKGCTDIDAVNYNILAEEDDGSCTYEGSIVFWYGEQTCDSLLAYASISLRYYVENNIVGSGSTSVYYTGAPDCGDDGTITVTKDIGSVKSKSYTYKVIDDADYEIWTGTLTFEANTCTSIELTWN